MFYCDHTGENFTYWRADIMANGFFYYLSFDDYFDFDSKKKIREITISDNFSKHPACVYFC